MTRVRGTSGVESASMHRGEDAAIAQILEISRQAFERNYTNVRPALRDQHAKSHGCVRAEFIVRSDVPVELRCGLFAEPRTYPAWIRFSSSDPHALPDSRRDVHGMAVKVLGVRGDKILPNERTATTQDFLLANSPVFFCRDALECVDFVSAFSEGNRRKFFLGPDPRQWRLRELVNGLIALSKHVVNPLQIRYWSQTPFALGTEVVKYSARPRVRCRSWRRASGGRNFLEEAMALQLSRREASFDFLVQVRTGSMPVEDPTVRWSTWASPFRKVATIRIPPQEFTGKANRDFAERLSFTPWHSLPEHRPLGGINRVRRAVYEVSATLRHEVNGVRRREPR